MRRCARCATTENLETHHVVPRCNGGGDGATQVLCHDCHVRQHAVLGPGPERAPGFDLVGPQQRQPMRPGRRVQRDVDIGNLSY